MKYVVETNADNGDSFYTEDFAVYRALGLFWVDPSAYVDIDPAEVEVDEVRV